MIRDSSWVDESSIEVLATANLRATLLQKSLPVLRLDSPPVCNILGALGQSLPAFAN